MSKANTTRGFTLIELLVVVAIMGLMGTAAVGGYRQMQRGLEERRVVDNATKFLSLAAERAQIDRQPVVVYYWNEMLRGADSDIDPEIIVGKAVAVRPRGRLTRVYQSKLIDEFGDLEQYDPSGGYLQNSEDSTEKLSTTKLYQLDNPANMQYSLVSNPELTRQTEYYVSSNPLVDTCAFEGTEAGVSGQLVQFGYPIVKNVGANWKVGSVYGLEFQTIELPHGYLFGSGLPQGMSSPVTEPTALAFQPQASDTLPSQSLPIYALRQVAGGSISPVRVGSATSSY